MTENQAGTVDKTQISTKIFADQVRMLYKNLLLSVTASFICSTIIFFGLTYHTTNGLFSTWYLAVILVSLGRLATYLLYSVRPSSNNYNLLIFLIGVILSATLWGMLGSILMPASHVLQQALVIVIIAGVTAGGAQSLQANLNASLLFVSIIIAPLCIWLFAQNEMTYSILGAAMTTYLLFMILTSVRNYRTLLEVLSLHYANISLVESLSISNKKLFESYKQLEQHEGELSNINKLNYLLQSCKEMNESYVVIGFIAKQLFSNLDGSLSIMNRKTNTLELITEWGEGCHLKGNFNFEDCLGLRNGREYHVNDASKQMICNHFIKPSASYICLPLMTQNKITGIMTLCTDQIDALNNYTIQLAMSFSEVVQLSLANISLRDSLYDQSIHDALTGLFNRRYLDVILNVELNRVMTARKSLCVVMIDLDNFKSINDVYGHGAGDEILRYIGKKLDTQFRKGDTAFRYGGDEFLVVLANSSLAEAAARLQIICDEIKNNKTYFDNTPLPSISASVGIAEAPLQGATVKDILHSADQALYLAKKSGRGTVVCLNTDVTIMK